MTKYIVANFKSHQTGREAQNWLNQFKSAYEPTEGKTVILAPSFTNLWLFQKCLSGVSSPNNPHQDKILLGAQDVSPFPPGAYTGAVSAAQLITHGISYCLVGHSERRKWFHETHQEIANKIRELLDQSITPILCLDQPYQQAQIAALEDGWLKELIIAYEPVEAIGSGRPQNPQAASQIASSLKNLSAQTPVLYGGSVTPQNAADYTTQKSIDGLLVGGISLNPDEFVNLINQA